MADEYDSDLVVQFLEETLSMMRVKQDQRFSKNVVALVQDIYDLAGKDSGLKTPRAGSRPGSAMSSGTLSIDDILKVGQETKKLVISARACVVCGKDDRPGEQRKSGFKCTDCIGLPSKLDVYSVQVEEMGDLSKSTSNGEKVINGFIFTKNLGKGSYGKVKLAVHQQSGQKYAAKILNKQTLQKVHKAGTQQTAMDAVRSEIAILKALNHPNIIKMYALIDDPDQTKLYLIMEFCEGGELHGGVKGMEMERLKKMIVGIARGLQYLHNKNIVHRDIKPENILLDMHDNVKLTDFGVSSSCKDEDDTMHSTEGSPAYFPPEEFEQIPVKGRAHDIWSFGVTVFMMAFGFLPFTDARRDANAAAVVQATPEYPPNADPLLVDLLKQMLAKEQDSRIVVNQILEHPLVSDVRTVKGMPVETIKVNVHVLDNPVSRTFLPKGIPPGAQAVLIPLTLDATTTTMDQRGKDAALSFLRTEGPEFQIIRSGVYCSTLYSIKSDPRRKAQNNNPRRTPSATPGLESLTKIPETAISIKVPE